jgi:hypothetical protein
MHNAGGWWDNPEVGEGFRPMDKLIVRDCVQIQFWRFSE